MSDNIKDGGPAFPLNSPSGTPEYMPARDGMSLRDWFAGQALAGFMSGLGSSSEWPSPQQIKSAAVYSYQAADAMLKARENKT